MSLAPRLLLVCATAGLVLSACGGGDDGAVSPLTAVPLVTSSSASPSASPSVTSSAPDFTPAGAEQFVRDYYATLNASIASMNPAAAQALTTSTCNCVSLYKTISEQQALGNKFSGGLFTVLSVTAGNSDTVLAHLDISENSLIHPDGSMSDTTPVTKNDTSLISLIRVPEGWRVSKIQKAV